MRYVLKQLTATELTGTHRGSLHSSQGIDHASFSSSPQSLSRSLLHPFLGHHLLDSSEKSQIDLASHSSSSCRINIALVIRVAPTEYSLPQLVFHRKLRITECQEHH